MENQSVAIWTSNQSDAIQWAMSGVLRVSATRDIRYSMCAKDQKPDLFLLDEVMLDSVSAWNEMRGYRESPTILITTPKSEIAKIHHSKYTIRLPIVPARLLMLLDEVVKNEINASTEIVEKAVIDTHIMKILLVDDSPTVQKQMELYLRSLNIKVDFAGTGEEALHLLKINQYDAMFLDVILPGLDGYQICKIVRKMTEFKKLPIIMLTSKSSPFDKIRGSIAGCDAYLSKPINAATLLEAINKYKQQSTLLA